MRRDRWVAGAGLAAIALLAWAYILAGGGTGMSAWDMTSASLFPHRAAAMGGMVMEPTAWTPAHAAIMLLMWWVMMIAMMTPSAAPMILLYAQVARARQAAGRLAAGGVPTAAFAGGYLSAWLGFAIVATTLQWVLDQAGLVPDMTMSSRSAALSGSILILAGLYQLTPWKQVCLQQCRTPAAFLSRYWRPRASGAVRMGIRHGLFCIGCCWMLMALLFVGGVMNLLWIAVLAVFILLEKVTAHGPWVARITGVILIAWGAAVLIA